MATIEARVNNDGSTSYRAKIRCGGITKSKTFRRKTDAVKWAQVNEGKILTGNYLDENEACKHTIAEAVKRYVQDSLDKESSDASNIVRHLDWLLKNYEDVTLDRIRPATIAEIRERLRNEPIRSLAKNADSLPPRYRQNATIVRYLASYSRLFSFVLKELHWVTQNPVLQIRKPKEPKGRDRFLSDMERKALLDACRTSDCSAIYPIVVLALSTGMRRGEIMNLTWWQVDFKNGFVRLEVTKNGEKRAVPLTGHALDQLRSLNKVRRIDTQLVFPNAKGTGAMSIERPWQSALRTAGIQDFRFHDLRHSAASYLAMNGASMLEIAGVLGHKTMQMVKRYSHISAPHTAAVVASMNQKIFAGE